jgi:hypothetical protein
MHRKAFQCVDAQGLGSNCRLEGRFGSLPRPFLVEKEPNILARPPQ